jgi:hypothetical protein
MRDNLPQHEIDLKIKTDIAGFFACYKKNFAPDEKNRRDRGRSRRFAMHRRRFSGRAR